MARVYAVACPRRHPASAAANPGDRHERCGSDRLYRSTAGRPAARRRAGGGAAGSVSNYFNTPGAAEHAIALDTEEQAARFHRRMVNACLRANAQTGPLRPGQLHCVIVGAGATGVELAAELHRSMRELAAFGLDRIDFDKLIRLTIVEAGPRILPALPERLSAAATELLVGLGGAVRGDTRGGRIPRRGGELG